MIAPVPLFVTGGTEIRSNERTTQGDPVEVAVYALGTNPRMVMIELVTAKSMTQKWLHLQLILVGKRNQNFSFNGGQYYLKQDQNLLLV